MMKTYLVKKPAGNLYDPFDDFFKPMFFDEQLDSMRTDIKETKEGFCLDIEMPGFKKEDIKVSLENGYLTVSAEKSGVNEEKNENGVRYLRKECSVSCQRSYYVGDDVAEEAVKAKYENGMLALSIPKVQPKKLAAKTIDIE